MKRRSRSRGFTLVELMVALVAGLIVTIAVVGLAKDATTTFYDEIRAQTAEATLRTGAERLRGDLTRTSFMSTGNIKWDPKVAHLVTKPNAEAYGDDIVNLAGLNISVAGSPAAPSNPDDTNKLSLNNGVYPDMLTVTGNLTTDDSYHGQWIAAGTCSGQRLELRPDRDAAVARLLKPANTALSPLTYDTTAGNALLANAFLVTTPAFARVEDMRGCFHYVEICAAGMIDAFSAYVDIKGAAGAPGIVPFDSTTSGTGNANCGGSEQEEFGIAPVSRMRWYLAKNTNVVLSPPAGVTTGDEFVLFRQPVGVDGALAGTAEVVAEYAVDLKFGIVAQDPLTNAMKIFDLDSDSGGGSIATTTRGADTTAAVTSAQLNPENVRSVRFRLSTRAALPDRTAPLVVAPGPFISRYCIDNNTAVASCKHFARVRTIVSEVALINQARMFY